MAKSNSPQKTLVEFKQKFRPYNVGETAGFPSDSETLKQILQRGIAVPVGVVGEPLSAGPSLNKTK